MNPPFIHPHALCESASIGAGTRIWAFVHVLAGASIGEDCNICDQVFIENDVVIGDRVTVKCGVQLYDGLRIENDVFIGPNATFTNDHFPRSKVYPETFIQTVIRERASIGANATILPGVVIGEGAMVGAGAVVTRSIPANAIVVGNPARIIGYVETRDSAPAPRLETSAPLDDGVSPVQSLGVGNASLIRLKSVVDLRGHLSVGDLDKDFPFKPKRYFLVFGVPSREVRGEHAHRECYQALICVKGSCNVLLDDGKSRREVVLDRPDLCVCMPPMIWGTQYRYSEDAVLLVFASHHYDPDDYIRTYNEFRAAVRAP